jgi:hypothetical protein
VILLSSNNICWLFWFFFWQWNTLVSNVSTHALFFSCFLQLGFRPYVACYTIVIYLNVLNIQVSFVFCCNDIFSLILCPTTTSELAIQLRAEACFVEVP